METHSTRAVGRRPAPLHAGVLPVPARVLVSLTVLCAGLAAAPALWYAEAPDWAGVVFLAVAACLAERFDINLYGDSRVSMSGLFLLTAAIALGPAAIVLIAPAVAVAGHAGRGRPFYKLAFNAGAFTLTSLASAYLFFMLLASPPGGFRVFQAAAAVLAGLADYAVSSALVSLIIAATSKSSPLPVWREKFAWLFPQFILAGVLAFILSLAYDSSLGVWAMLGFTAPVMMARHTMKQYIDRTELTVTGLRAKHAEVEALTRELQGAYDDTLQAVAAALDIRDVETHGHSSRVAELSVRIGEAMGIVPGTQEGLDLKHGAMLHDVGKIGVPDSILRKPGTLTAEEWEAIRRHPRYGYEMLHPVGFLRRAAELVLRHHERFDGGGYPAGLQGGEIPLAARIFAVADAFDAITSARPYKPARSVAEALDEIKRHSGTQFDPSVVRTLLTLKAETLKTPPARAA